MEKPALSIANLQSESFSQLTRLLIKKFKPVQLFCFAQNRVFKEDSNCFTEEKISASAYYCLLMVTESDTPTGQTVQKLIDSRSSGVTILCYTQKAVSAAFVAKNRFFLTIYNSSKLLYSREELLQSDYIREHSPFNVYKKAHRKSTQFKSLADSFFAGATHSFYNQEYPMCVLMLNQVTEQCLKLILCIHMPLPMEAYSLSTLLGLCRSFSNQPQHLLLSTKEDERLFGILTKSNSALCISSKFCVSEKDATQLFIRVSALLKLVRLLYTDRLAQLEHRIKELM